MRSTQVQLSGTDFETGTVDLPAPAPGQVLVANHYMALGAAMRSMLGAGSALPAKTLGTVLISADPHLPQGSTVVHMAGWRTHAVLDVAQCRAVTGGDPLLQLSSGLTAYAGLRLVGVRPGDTVYVSSAAGAVGSAAGLLARTLGAGRVIGGTSTPAKVRTLVDEFGYDEALHYGAGGVPDGVDVYFDNVGGDHLNTVIAALQPHGRVVLCGALAEQLGGATAPRLDLMTVIGNRLSLHGFRTADHLGLEPEFAALVVEHHLTLPHVVVDGLDRAATALMDLFAGRYTGVVLVRLDGAAQ
jgi:NADPH-dependent curcumin reductase CurA